MIEQYELPKAISLKNFLNENGITLKIGKGEGTFGNPYWLATLEDCEHISSGLNFRARGNDYKGVVDSIIEQISGKEIYAHGSRIKVPYLK